MKVLGNYFSLAFGLLLLGIYVNVESSGIDTVKHIVNDGVSKTIFYKGCDTGTTNALVTLRAKGGNGGKAGMNISLVCDFSSSMRDQNITGTDTNKAIKMFYATKRFIYGRDTTIAGIPTKVGRHVNDSDAVNIVRYAYGLQFFPESKIKYNIGVLPPNDTFYSDTFVSETKKCMKTNNLMLSFSNERHFNDKVIQNHHINTFVW